MNLCTCVSEEDRTVEGGFVRVTSSDVHTSLPTTVSPRHLSCFNDCETINREMNRRPIYNTCECRCDERVKSKGEGSKLLTSRVERGTGTPCCLLLFIDKARVKDKTYI